MRPLPREEQERVQKQFDSFCKKILKYAACDFYRALNYRKKHEVAFNELSEQELAKFSVTDDYFKDAYSFTVQGYDVAVSDELLAEALNRIPADRRDIILLACCLGMSDREIAEQLNLVRRTVAYRRTTTLQELKKIMEGSENE